MDVNNVISSERGVLQENVRRKVVELMRKYQTGINVRSVTIQKTTVPMQVEQAYNDVVNAQADKRRFISEGEIYNTERESIVQGITQCLANKAAAYSTKTINKAKGDVKRFNALYKSFSGGATGTVGNTDNIKNVTMQRLYFDAMQKALSETTNIVMDSNAPGSSSSNMMYLPLDKIINGEQLVHSDSSASNDQQTSRNQSDDQSSDLAYCEKTVKDQYYTSKNTDAEDSINATQASPEQKKKGGSTYGSA